MPEAVGVPLIVMVLLAHAAVTPGGNPVGVPMPVATVVVCVMGANGVLMHKVGEEDAAPTVLPSFILTVKLMTLLAQPNVELRTVNCAV